MKSSQAAGPFRNSGSVETLQRIIDDIKALATQSVADEGHKTEFGTELGREVSQEASLAGNNLRRILGEFDGRRPRGSLGDQSRPEVTAAGPPHVETFGRASDSSPSSPGRHADEPYGSTSRIRVKLTRAVHVLSGAALTGLVAVSASWLSTGAGLGNSAGPRATLTQVGAMFEPWLSLEHWTKFARSLAPAPIAGQPGRPSEPPVRIAGHVTPGHVLHERDPGGNATVRTNLRPAQWVDPEPTIVTVGIPPAVDGDIAPVPAPEQGEPGREAWRTQLGLAGPPAEGGPMLPRPLDLTGTEPILILPDAIGSAGTATPLTIMIVLVGQEGTEVVEHVSIGGLPHGAQLSDGRHTATSDSDHGGSVDISDWNLADLTFRAPVGIVGDLVLSVTASSRHVATGAVASAQKSFAVHVQPNESPSGPPSGMVGDGPGAVLSSHGADARTDGTDRPQPDRSLSMAPSVPELPAPGTSRESVDSVRSSEAIETERDSALQLERERSQALTRELAAVLEQLGAMKARSSSWQAPAAGEAGLWLYGALLPGLSASQEPVTASGHEAESEAMQAREHSGAAAEQTVPAQAPPLPASDEVRPAATGSSSQTNPTPPLSTGRHQPGPPVAVPPAQMPPLSPEEGRLLARAESMLRLGDVSGARLLLQHAARTGNARATYLLAQTYDQRLLSRWRVLTIRGDDARARELYAEAYRSGVEEAKVRLEALR